MKIVEKLLEKRLQCMVKVNKIQFGFMPGKGKVDAVFILRRLQEENLEKEKKRLRLGFSLICSQILPNVCLRL